MEKQAKIRIKFEDFGNFTFLDLDSNGKVVDCHPYHRQIWIGRQIDLETVKQGFYPEYIIGGIARETLNYRIKKVIEL
ncbi:MAG TPA: hypothetical protein DD458_01395 [Prolixibacteraceae bacterium]|nr:MAG: hypothetical protein A2W89_06770 [Bacteroidetes bacterium GWE2_42_39]HBL73859.1 hypothetical protein [Prolixibacteraceae bacterium]HCU63208.1 hypothetical protein [Prolixibacteraceae bacterium]